jgi:hypothetical protein
VQIIRRGSIGSWRTEPWRLIRDAAKKIFLILDNPRVHHAKVVQQWLAENADKIEVFYLPSYSP